jgi:hypothetical protein
VRHFGVLNRSSPEGFGLGVPGGDGGRGDVAVRVGAGAGADGAAVGRGCGSPAAEAGALAAAEPVGAALKFGRAFATSGGERAATPADGGGGAVGTLVSEVFALAAGADGRRSETTPAAAATSITMPATTAARIAPTRL